MNLVSNGTAKDSQRVLARAVLALLVGMLATLVALSGGPLTSTVTAQETPSPTESPTESPDESPSPVPTGPAIQLWNPSGYSDPSLGPYVTDGDIEDGHYHLVATTFQAPPDTIVEFEAERAGVRRALGTGTRVGDTFHLEWVIPDDFPRGFTYVFLAVMFSEGELIASDQFSAFVPSRRGLVTDPSEPDIAVRIDYPSVGGPWGLFQPPIANQPFRGIVDFTFSSGTTRVRGFYTKSAPGTEPEWIACGTTTVSTAAAGAAAPGAARHLCTLAAEDVAADVTGVALVSNFTTPSQASTSEEADASGDAHRVLPYVQVPANVSLSVQGPEPGVEGPRQYDVRQCTNQIFATVTDEFARPIVRANVDVHATGPLEEAGRLGVRFDATTGTDARQAPDQNHADTMSGSTCTGAASGTQGNHRRPGQADTRHVESTVAFTNVNGQWRFRLWNDQPGGTQITAWADIADNDLYCGNDPSADMSIGWGAAPPPVTGHDIEADDCPRGPPPPPPPPEEVTVDRGVGMQLRGVGANRARARGRVRAGGRPRCARRVPVRIQRRVGDRWRILRRTRTNARRIYRARFPDRPGRYRAVAPRVTDESPAGEKLICRRAISRVRRR